MCLPSICQVFVIYLQSVCYLFAMYLHNGCNVLAEFVIYSQIKCRIFAIYLQILVSNWLKTFCKGFFECFTYPLQSVCRLFARLVPNIPTAEYILQKFVEYILQTLVQTLCKGLENILQLLPFVWVHTNGQIDNSE